MVATRAKSSQPNTACIQNNLLHWYQRSKRDLPWRRTQDPYAIWVSEIMLQQTRVETVVDYWLRFLQAFPTVETLAQATEEDVLQLWQGLGYYRRAKLLHQAAKQIVDLHRGKLPNRKDELIKLSGFGPYTAGAVASIAFGEKVACVDGNVSRVLSRVFATHLDVSPWAEKIAQHPDPSSINQSLMELGATICLPQNPKCERCTLQEQCLAQSQEQIHLYPAAKAKPKIKSIYATALILRHKQQSTWFLQKRPGHGRWPNMWEFPYFEFDKKPTGLRSYLQKKFPTAHHFKKQGIVKHQLTHQSIQVQVYTAYIRDIPKQTPTQIWVEDINARPTSTLTQKIKMLL